MARVGLAPWNVLIAAHDSSARNAALSSIAASSRVDFYWTSLIAHLGQAIVRTRLVSTEGAEVRLIGRLSAVAIPSYSPLSSACNANELQASEAREHCRGAASALSKGDTFITEMFGASLTQRLWPGGSVDWSAARLARRTHQFLSKSVAALPSRGSTGAEEFLLLCQQYSREQEVFRAQLRARGMATESLTE